MHPSSRVFLAALASSMALPAFTQDADDRPRLAAQKARQDQRASRFLAAAAAKVAPQPEVQLVFGLARDVGQDDERSFTTPLSLGYESAGESDGDGKKNWWRVGVSGDGYTHATGNDQPNVSGLADLRLDVSKNWNKAWTGTAGFGIPTGGEAGTHRSYQHLRFNYDDGLKDSKFGVGVWGDLKRRNTASDGLGRYSTLAYAELNYSLPDDQTILANATYSRRRGADPKGSTDLGVEYDFPLYKKLNGAMSFVRGVTKGATHSTVEFDFSYNF